MHAYIKTVIKVTACIAFVAGLVGWHFAGNIRAYFRFKELCGIEGGLKVVVPLRKNVGWLARLNDGGLMVASFKEVAFVRIPDANGRFFDYRYRSGRIEEESSYGKVPAIESNSAMYEVRWVDEPLLNEIRTNRSGYEVREISTKHLAARWYQIGFRTFNQLETLFEAPSGQACYPWDGFFDSKNQAKLFSKE